MNDATLLNFKTGDCPSIDKSIGHIGKTLYSTTHRNQPRLTDIELLDLLNSRQPHRPANLLPADRLKKTLPLERSEKLGVVKTGETCRRKELDRGRNHGTGE